MTFSRKLYIKHKRLGHVLEFLPFLPLFNTNLKCTWRLTFFFLQITGNTMRCEVCKIGRQAFFRTERHPPPPSCHEDAACFSLMLYFQARSMGRGGRCPQPQPLLFLTTAISFFKQYLLKERLNFEGANVTPVSVPTHFSAAFWKHVNSRHVASEGGGGRGQQIFFLKLAI